MELNETVLEGTIQDDGTLVLDEPTKLPAGRVTVVVQSLESQNIDGGFWDRMDAMWTALEADGYVPRSEEEIAAAQAETRMRWNERQTEIESLQKRTPTK